MKLRVYSIYDRKAESYMQPFFFTSDGQATRVFQDMANDDSHLVGRHPEDFELYLVGQFVDESGELAGLDKPRFVVGAHSLRRKDS